MLHILSFKMLLFSTRKSLSSELFLNFLWIKSTSALKLIPFTLLIEISNSKIYVKQLAISHNHCYVIQPQNIVQSK